jgi:hypothetical protein
VIGVDLGRYSCDQLDEGLGVVITWSSLSSNHDDSWWELACSLLLWGIEDTEISVDDIEDVHELSLVLVNTFNLDIVKGIKWDVISGLVLYPLLELSLVGSLDGVELLDEVLVTSVWLELLEVVEGELGYSNESIFLG